MQKRGALSTLARIFEEDASKKLLVLADGREVTYWECWQRAENIARRLVDLGMARGSRLLIQLENSGELLAVYLACAMGGYVACPIDPDLPEHRVSAMRSALQPVSLLNDDSLSTLLLAPQSPPSALGGSGSDDDYLIMFSSGSTGEPKGIVHSLTSIVESAASFATLAGMNGDSVVYHHFPMFYMAGIFNLFFCPLLAAGTIVVGPRFSNYQMLRFWELPLQHGVNCLTLTPTMAHSLCQLYRRDDRLLEHLSKYQTIVATGSSLYSSIAERFYAVFKVPLRSCYGVTEIGGTITFQSWEDALAYQSVGTYAPNTVIRAGGQGVPAEILVKTPFMAKGYLINGELTTPYDGEGFFHTGDRGYLQDGLLFFTGREHDLVKKGGEFVSTQLVEGIALRNRLVTDVSVVTVTDEFWGTKLVLFYVPRVDATEPDILSGFAQLFADDLREVERPDRIIPVPWMPKTAVGKTIKRELIQKYTVGNSGWTESQSHQA